VVGSVAGKTRCGLGGLSVTAYAAASEIPSRPNITHVITACVVLADRKSGSFMRRQWYDTAGDDAKREANANALPRSGRPLGARFTSHNEECPDEATATRQYPRVIMAV
jgi:hypothetical protein